MTVEAMALLISGRASTREQAVQLAASGVTPLAAVTTTGGKPVPVQQQQQTQQQP